LAFEDALEAEDNRKSKNWAFGWHYKSVGFYYNQVKAYLESFSEVMVCLYDDLKNDPMDLVRRIFIFLGVDPGFTPDTSVRLNISGIPKSRFAHNLLTKPTLLKTTIKVVTKPLFLKPKARKLKDTLIRKNLRRPEMKTETHEYLKNLYREDILKLQDLINKDLSHWLK